MTVNYETLDYLPDLTNYQMSSAGILSFKPLESDDSRGWDNRATYGSFYFSVNDDFQWQGLEGATYDIFSFSYFTPFLVTVYDNLGNTIAVESDEISYGSYISSTKILWDFVAPYTGTYYVSAGWHQKDTTYAYLTIYENTDTAINSIVEDIAVNHLPTGEITILGTAKQDEILTVSSSLADEDGLGDFEYQWLRDATEIFDATAETYKPSATDIGKKISVKVSYIDGEGTLETVTSLATVVVKGKSATTGNDLLIGTNGKDTISGLTGNDTLVGGLGKDTLTGGIGADVFKFNETGKTSKTRDTITDFKSSEGDKIDLSGIDANTRLVGDQAFKFIGSKAFSGNAGEVRFDSKTAILYGNVNNDKIPDFAIKLNGVKSLVVDDFVL